MVLSQTFFSLLFITLSVDASPQIRRDMGKRALAFSMKIHMDAAEGTLPERDRAHAHEMMKANMLSKRSASSVKITNDVVYFTAQVGVGEPPHNYTLVIDTGSSNTWVGANVTNPYIRTNTSINTGDSFALSYGSGNVTGTQYLDSVTLSSSLVIKNQSIGVASSASGFQDVDGILGVGPVDLTLNTVGNTTTVPTLMDNLYSQGKISEDVLGIYFVPSAENSITGELTFGDYDHGVITTPIKYVPLTTTANASAFWGVNQSITYDSKIIQSNAAGIIDTGNTLVLLETRAFRKYQNATGGVLDQSTGLLAIDPGQYAHLKPLKFNIGGVRLDLTPNAQIWPRSLNTLIGGNASAIYLVVSDLGTLSGTGLQFINGYSFLERFYSVFDTTNRRIGFAKTAYTDLAIN